jgi:hypothetical protein
VLARHTLYLFELKYYRSILTGNGHLSITKSGD